MFKKASRVGFLTSIVDSRRARKRCISCGEEGLGEAKAATSLRHDYDNQGHLAIPTTTVAYRSLSVEQKRD